MQVASIAIGDVVRGLKASLRIHREIKVRNLWRLNKLLTNLKAYRLDKTQASAVPSLELQDGSPFDPNKFNTTVAPIFVVEMTAYDTFADLNASIFQSGHNWISDDGLAPYWSMEPSHRIHHNESFVSLAYQTRNDGKPPILLGYVALYTNHGRIILPGIPGGFDVPLQGHIPIVFLATTKDKGYHPPDPFIAVVPVFLAKNNHRLAPALYEKLPDTIRPPATGPQGPRIVGEPPSDGGTVNPQPPSSPDEQPPVQNPDVPSERPPSPPPPNPERPPSPPPVEGPPNEFGKPDPNIERPPSPGLQSPQMVESPPSHPEQVSPPPSDPKPPADSLPPSDPNTGGKGKGKDPAPPHPDEMKNPLDLHPDEQHSPEKVQEFRPAIDEVNKHNGRINEMRYNYHNNKVQLDQLATEHAEKMEVQQAEKAKLRDLELGKHDMEPAEVQKAVEQSKRAQGKVAQQIKNLEAKSHQISLDQNVLEGRIREVPDKFRHVRHWEPTYKEGHLMRPIPPEVANDPIGARHPFMDPPHRVNPADINNVIPTMDGAADAFGEVRVLEGGAWMVNEARVHAAAAREMGLAVMKQFEGETAAQVAARIGGFLGEMALDIAVGPIGCAVMAGQVIIDGISKLVHIFKDMKKRSDCLKDHSIPDSQCPPSLIEKIRTFFKEMIKYVQDKITECIENLRVPGWRQKMFPFFFIIGAWIPLFIACTN